MTTVVAEASAVTSVSVDVAGTTAVTGGFVTAIPVILGVCGQQHTTMAVTAVVVITVPTEELDGEVSVKPKPNESVVTQQPTTYGEQKGLVITMQPK